MTDLKITCPTRRKSRVLNIVESELIITMLNGDKHKETCTLKGTELMARVLAVDGENYDKFQAWLKKLGKDTE